MNRLELLKSVRKIVAYHRDCGVGYYPKRAAALTGLPDRVVTATAGAGADGANPASDTGAEMGTAVNSPDPQTDSKVQPSESMLEMTRQISSCTLCSLHHGRQCDTAGRGGAAPLLLVVGGWLSMGEGRLPATGMILGEEQDQMLGRMITAMGLAPEDVFVTNIIKCSVSAAARPTGEQIDTCVNYLKQQIVQLSPKIICAMGPTATHTLLATRRSLSQLRGRFHDCKLPSAATFRVMPTYHPSYLLKNPEMKKAAWADLQMIQKALGKA